MSPLGLQVTALAGGIFLACVVAVCAVFNRSPDGSDAGCVLLILGLLAGLLIFAGLGGLA